MPSRKEKRKSCVEMGNRRRSTRLQEKSMDAEASYISSPPNHEFNKQNDMGNRRRSTTPQEKLMDAEPSYISSPPNHEEFPGAVAACPASSIKEMGQTEETSNHCASWRSEKMFKEADFLSSPKPLKTVDEDEPEENSCGLTPSLQAVIDNIAGSLSPARMDSPSISSSCANQFVKRPLTLRLVMRGKKFECTAAERVDRSTPAIDAANVRQFSLDFTTPTEAAKECNTGAPPSSPINNLRVEENACNANPNIKHPSVTLNIGPTGMSKEANKFSCPKPGATVTEAEPKDNSCSDCPFQLQALLDNIAGPLSSAPRCSPSISLRYANQCVEKPATSGLAVRRKKVEECRDIAFFGTDDKLTAATDATSVKQIRLDFTARHGGSQECNADVPPLSSINNLRAIDASSSNSSSMATEQVPMLEAIAASNSSKERVEENACNPNPNTDNASQTLSIGLTEMASMWVDEDSGAEVESAQEYRVSENFAPTLRKIVEKHGDIAVNYIMETPAGRSLALENVCELIQTLQDKKFCEFTVSEIEKLLALVYDFEKAGLIVDWLKQRLDDILEARKLVKQSSTLKKERDRSNQVLIEKKSQVEVYESQILALQKKLSSARKELDAARSEARNIREKVSNAKRKVARFAEHPLLDKLL